MNNLLIILGLALAYKYLGAQSGAANLTGVVAAAPVFEEAPYTRPDMVPKPVSLVLSLPDAPVITGGGGSGGGSGSGPAYAQAGIYYTPIYVPDSTGRYQVQWVPEEVMPARRPMPFTA